MTFELPADLIAELRSLALAQRKTLNEIGLRALRKQATYMRSHPPKRLKPGLRRGRPPTRPSRRRPSD